MSERCEWVKERIKEWVNDWVEWLNCTRRSCWRRVFRWPYAAPSVWSPSVCRCAWWQRMCTSWSERATGSQSQATSEHMADEKPSHPLSPDVSYHDVCYLYERRAVAHRRSFILLQAGRPASNQRRDQIQQITDRIQELNGKLGQRLQRETGVNVWSKPA